MTELNQNRHVDLLQQLSYYSKAENLSAAQYSFSSICPTVDTISCVAAEHRQHEFRVMSKNMPAALVHQVVNVTLLNPRPYPQSFQT